MGSFQWLKLGQECNSKRKVFIIHGNISKYSSLCPVSGIDFRSLRRTTAKPKLTARPLFCHFHSHSLTHCSCLRHRHRHCRRTHPLHLCRRPQCKRSGQKRRSSERARDRPSIQPSDCTSERVKHERDEAPRPIPSLPPLIPLPPTRHTSQPKWVSRSPKSSPI